jgi:hypothetical protein
MASTAVMKLPHQEESSSAYGTTLGWAVEGSLAATLPWLLKMPKGMLAAIYSAALAAEIANQQ